MKTSRTQKTKKDAIEEEAPPPISRVVRVDDIADGKRCIVEASAAEREAIRALLGLVGLDRLHFEGTFNAEGQGGFLLTGTLAAKLTQTCVVSLEPIETELETPVEIEFWPEAQVERFAITADEAPSQESLDWPEPIVDGKIDLGRAVYETFATSIDPYPRRESASFAWSEGEGESEAETRPDSPFAALSRLKTP